MHLSVIVCTKNRAHAIAGCLDSIALALANASPLEAEIVVVDNASEDDTSAVVHAWATSCAIPVRLLFESRKGLAAARNCGVRGSRGDLLAFTDDDCRLDLAYVVDLLAHFQTDNAPTLRGGRVELGDPLDLPITIKTDDEAAEYAHPTHPGGFIHGANMAMPRTVVDRLGPFDERFGAGTKLQAGEDTDYIIRASAAGLRVQYVPDMAVLHFHGRRDQETARRLYAGYMRANGALYVKHLWDSPLLIRHLWWDIKHWYGESRGQEKFLPEADIGYGETVVGNVIGMGQFAASQVRVYLLSLLRLRG